MVYFVRNYKYGHKREQTSTKQLSAKYNHIKFALIWACGAKRAQLSVNKHKHILILVINTNKCNLAEKVALSCAPCSHLCALFSAQMSLALL